MTTSFSPRQYMVSRDFEVYYYEEFPQQKLPDHTHDYYEFYLFLEGDVTMHILGAVHKLRYGDVVIIPPFTQHHVEIGSFAVPYRRFVFWVSRDYLDELSASSADYSYAAEYVASSGEHVFHNDMISFSTLQTKIFYLLEEMHSERFGRQCKISLGIDDLILDLNRLIYEQRNAAAGSSQDISRSILSYIDEHLDEDLSLQKLADALYLNKYYISHIFKEDIGMPIHQYIVKKRVLACHDAITRGDKITEVWRTFGFSDYSSFYRAFKAEYKLSPREYQDTVRPGRSASEK